MKKRCFVCDESRATCRGRCQRCYNYWWRTGQEWAPGVRRNSGAAGGKATLAKYGPEHFRGLGRKGGTSVSRDRAHMAAIGAMGGYARRKERGPCLVCLERPAAVRGRCGRCNTYFSRRGTERPMGVRRGRPIVTVVED
jgi:hypothetical protein